MIIKKKVDFRSSFLSSLDTTIKYNNNYYDYYSLLSFRALTSSLFTPGLTLSMKKKRFLESFPLHEVPTQLCIPTDLGPLDRCVKL